MLKLIHKTLLGLLLTSSTYLVSAATVGTNIPTDSNSTNNKTNQVLQKLLDHSKNTEKLFKSKSNAVNPEEAYEVMLIEMALIDQDYKEFVRLVARFTKQHRVFPEYIRLAILSIPATHMTEEILEPARELYALDPDSKPLQSLMALLFAASGRYEELELILDKNFTVEVLSNKDREKVDETVKQLAAVLILMPEPSKALEYFEKYSKGVNPNNLVYLQQFAQFSLSAKNYSKAWDAASRYYDLNPNKAEGIDLIYAFLGVEEYRQNAFEIIKAFNVRAPKPIYESSEFAMLLHSAIETRALSHEYIDWLRKSYPDAIQFILVEAMMAYIEVNDAKALKLVDEFYSIANKRLEKDPNDRPSLLLMSRANLIKLDVLIREPIKDYKEILRLLALVPEDEMDFKYLISKAEALMQTWRVPEGIALLQDTITRYPDLTQPAVSYGVRTLIDVGRSHMALDLVKPYYYANPKSGTYSELMAWAYQASGDIKKAEEVYRFCLRHNPDEVSCLNGLGYMFADLNFNLDEALDLLRTAHSLDPSSPYVKDSLGWVYHKLGMTDMALLYIQASYNDEPMAETAAHLVEIYYGMGDVRRAKQYAREGLKLYQFTEYLQNTLRKLKIDLNEDKKIK